MRSARLPSALGVLFLSLFALGCGRNKLAGTHPDEDGGAPVELGDAGDLDAGSLDAGDGGLDASCASSAPPSGIEFGPSVVLSDPANRPFAPAIAARAGQVLVAWHEFTGTDSQIVYDLIRNGCVEARRTVSETLTKSMRPSVAATTSGYVLAYEATDGSHSVLRSVALDADGQVIGGPTTVSAPGATALYGRVAAAGDNVAISWTDGVAHHFALVGQENLPATAVGTALQMQWALNFPRIALTSDGTLFLAYSDIPSPSAGTLTELYLVARPRGGAFGAPVNLSQSPNQMSTEASVALEADGTLDLVWNEQDQANVDVFDVVYSRRSTGGQITAPARFGSQGQEAWGPWVAPGLAAVWQIGLMPSSGDLYFSPGPVPPVRIFAGMQATTPVLARAPDGTLHLAFVEVAAQRQLRYAWRP